jgi:ribosomal-protein-serine acetyltransferase
VFATNLTAKPGVHATLRPLEPWQAPEFAAHMDRAREHIRPWVGPSFVTDTVDAAHATLQRYADTTARDGNRMFGIWDSLVEPVETTPVETELVETTPAPTLVGGVMFVEFSAAAGTCEIGCWLEPAAEGRGLITAACRMLLAYAFEERGLHRAEWRCRADNARSSAVAERLGMTLEGVLRKAWLSGGVFHDKQVWSVLSSEFAARPPGA